MSCISWIYFSSVWRMCTLQPIHSSWFPYIQHCVCCVSIMSILIFLVIFKVCMFFVREIYLCWNGIEKSFQLWTVLAAARKTRCSHLFASLQVLDFLKYHESNIQDNTYFRDLRVRLKSVKYWKGLKYEEVGCALRKEKVKREGNDFMSVYSFEEQAVIRKDLFLV